MGFLELVAYTDVKELQHKEATYQGSWKKRGGVGAFMMCARKWDRLENMCQRGHYDIFALIGEVMSGEDGSALAEIRDLRRYLLLIEAEMIARKHGKKPILEESDILEAIRPGTPEDGGHHERMVPRQPEVMILERLEDGLQSDDIPKPSRDWYMTAINNGAGYNIVDRRKTPSELWQHLPRLRIELNNAEHEAIAPYYRGLYEWNGSDNKWMMRKPYHMEWSKEAL